jgi:hypothetical protein
LRVEVVYALAHAQEVVSLEMVQGGVASEAVEASGICERHGLPVGKLRLAIFGKAVSASQRLRAGDRVEILRGLAADPNAARRRRARQR